MSEPDEPATRGALAFLRRHAIDVSPLRESRDFRLLLAGTAVAEFGTEITLVAVAYQVYAITGSTLAVGLLGLCDLVPVLFLPLVGGAIADAVERRRFGLLALTCELLLVMSLVVNSRLTSPHLWVLYAFSVLFAATYSIYSPSFRAWPARLLPIELMPSAMSLEAALNNTAWLAGPAVAGLLIAWVGLFGAYVADVLTYAVVFIALAAMKPSPPTAERVSIGLESIREGLRFLRGKNVLQATFWVDLIAMIFGMPNALFPAFALRRLHRGPATVGLLYAAPAAGALLANLVSGRAKHVRRQGVAIMIAVSCWGAAIAGFGFSSVTWLALGFLAAAGAADMVSGIFRDAVLKRETPDPMRGRLEGISLIVVGGGPSLGNLEAGALASLTSVPFSIVAGGVACLVGVGVLAAVSAKFRSYRVPTSTS
jgi:MFS family permease